MRVIPFIASAVVLALASPSSAATIFYTDLTSFDADTSPLLLVEDFESGFAVNTALFGPQVVAGNTYTGLAGAPLPNVYVSEAGFTNYGLPGPTPSRVLTANGDEDFTVDFSLPATAVGFDTYLNGFGGTLSVFGDSGLLGSFALSHHAPTVIGFLGVTTMEPITQIRWTTVLGGQINTGIDNIRLGKARVVPEPSFLLLLGLGLGGIGALRRRR